MFRDIIIEYDMKIRDLIFGLTESFDILTFSILLSIAFIYGLLHSLGPGHGKGIIASFFLKEKHPLKKSVILAGIVSATHTGAAIILSFLIYFILTGIRGMMRLQMNSYFYTASGLAILLVGIVFLLFKVFHKKHSNIPANNTKSLIIVGLTAGMVPCPVSLTIMLLALQNNLILPGLITVISISLGMFVLLLTIGLISIKSRDGILFLSDKTVKKTEVISSALEYISIFLIISIGSVMSYSFIAGFIKKIFTS